MLIRLYLFVFLLPLSLVCASENVEKSEQLLKKITELDSQVRQFGVPSAIARSQAYQAGLVLAANELVELAAAGGLEEQGIESFKQALDDLATKLKEPKFKIVPAIDTLNSIKQLAYTYRVVPPAPEPDFSFGQGPIYSRLANAKSPEHKQAIASIIEEISLEGAPALPAKQSDVINTLTYFYEGPVAIQDKLNDYATTIEKMSIENQLGEDEYKKLKTIRAGVENLLSFKQVLLSAQEEQLKEQLPQIDLLLIPRLDIPSSEGVVAEHPLQPDSEKDLSEEEVNLNQPLVKKELEQPYKASHVKAGIGAYAIPGVLATATSGSLTALVAAFSFLGTRALLKTPQRYQWLAKRQKERPYLYGRVLKGNP
jgi:hypothetical protein